MKTDKVKTKQIVMIVLAALLFILIIQNSTMILVNFFFWPLAMPIFFLVLGVFAVGLIIGYLAAKVDRKKKPQGQPASLKAEDKAAPVPPVKPGGPGSSDSPPPGK